MIHHTEGNRISFGEPDGSKSARALLHAPARAGDDQALLARAFWLLLGHGRSVSAHVLVNG